MSKGTLRRLIILFKLTVMVGLVSWLLDSGQMDFTQILDQPFSALHLAGVVVLLVNFGLSGYRWFLLLRIQLPHVRPGRVIGWMWISEFFAMVTPGGGGGELARSYYAIRNHPEARIAAFSSVLIDRMVGLVSLLFLGAASYGMFLLSGRQVTAVTHYLGMATGASLVVVILGSAALFIRPMRILFSRFISDDLAQATTLIMTTYWRQKMVVAYGFLLSLIGQLFLIFPFWIAADVMAVDMDYLASFLVIPLTLIANILPVSPGGMGVGETAASFMFAQFSVLNGAGLMVLVRIWLMILQIGGGLWYLLEKDGRFSPR